MTSKLWRRNLSIVKVKSCRNLPGLGETFAERLSRSDQNLVRCTWRPWRRCFPVEDREIEAVVAQEANNAAFSNTDANSWYPSGRLPLSIPWHCWIGTAHFGIYPVLHRKVDKENCTGQARACEQPTESTG